MRDDLKLSVGFSTTDYVVIKPQRYKHQIVAGRCVQCGQDRPGACSCMPVQQYSWTTMQEDYKSQCAEMMMGEAVLRLSDSMMMLGDALKSWMPEDYFAMVNQRTRERNDLQVVIVKSESEHDARK